MYWCQTGCGCEAPECFFRMRKRLALRMALFENEALNHANLLPAEGHIDESEFYGHSA